MNDTVLSLLTGLIPGAITAVVTYFATFARARLDLTIEYDKELRQKRLEAYRELWKRLKAPRPFLGSAPIRPISGRGRPEWLPGR